MAVSKKQISATVMPEIAPRIETWLMGRNVYYEVEPIKNGARLKIIACFPAGDYGEHQAEMYESFLDRIKRK